VLSRRLPSALAFTDRSAIRREFRRWAQPRYDIAFFAGADGWYALSDLVDAPKIVDLPDLLDVWVERQRTIAPASDTTRPSVALNVRDRLRGWRLATTSQRWTEYYRFMATKVATVTVCSALDAERLGAPNVRVLPNGYDRRTGPVGRPEVGTPPTFVFPGLMTYGPNADGAKYFVDDILPELLRLLPSARFVIAGDAPPGVRKLSEHANVEVTGWIDDMDTALARADAVVVPLRVGGGTRIKIIEAWAHHIPVVSTSVGAEGLDCASGRELLLADAPEAFAEACRDIVSNATLRGALVEAGSARAAALTWTATREVFRDVVRNVTDARPSS